MDLQNAHSKYSPNCSRRQRALATNDERSKADERRGNVTDERFSEWVEDDVGDEESYNRGKMMDYSGRFFFKSKLTSDGTGLGAITKGISDVNDVWN